MDLKKIVDLIPAASLPALLADMSEAALRAGVTAALAAGDAPPATVAAAAATAVKASKAPKAPTVAAPTVAPPAVAKIAAKAASKPASAGGPLAYALAELAKVGFARGELAAAAGLQPADPAVSGAIKQAVKAGSLFGFGEKRYSRYGATLAIAQARSEADRAK